MRCRCSELGLVDEVSAPILIGQGVADTSGAYSITTIPLNDGTYDIDAIAISKFGGQSALALIESGLHPLVIDTAGPKIIAFSVSNTLKGQFQVEYQDERSGLVTTQLVNGSNYDVQRTVPKPLPLQNFIVSRTAWRTFGLSKFRSGW